ncbi:MAG: NAD-dependent epimerase/dehydratase family protein, partial [Geobacteraceae bacterium]
LLQLGHAVLVIDDLSTGKIGNIEHLLNHPCFHFTRESIMNELVLDRLASESDTIIHLAAAVGVKLIVDQPVHTIETNVMGTQAILRAALRYRCRTLLASSSEVYGKGNGLPFAEEDDVVLGPTSKCRWAYAQSKMIDESLGLAYHREFDLDVVAFRLFNTVGPKQTDQYGMVVPTFVRQALRNQPITVCGDGSQRRCFCYVGDVVAAILLLAEEKSVSGKVLNIGSEEETSILDLARRIRQLTGSVSAIELIPYSQAYGEGFEDMAYRKPNTRRIRDCVGWKPKYQLDEILRQIIDYENGPQTISSAAWQETKSPSTSRFSIVAHSFSHGSGLRPKYRSADNGPMPAG